MNSAAQSEALDNSRLRNATDFLAHSKEAEAKARKELNRAIEHTRLARANYETKFAECEKRAVERRKAGQIEVLAGY